MALKLKAAFETEVYISEGGYVAIKQKDPVGEPDTIVLLTAEQLDLVVDELQRLQASRAEWWDPREEDA